MPFTQQLLLTIPPFILGLLTLGIGVTLSIGGLIIVRKFIPHQKLKAHHDVAGPIFSTLGVVYAVLLGFVVVTVWQNFDRSRLNVEREANCLLELSACAESFNTEMKEQVRSLTAEYARAVVDQEWPMIARGQESPYVENIVSKIWILYSNYLPGDETEQVFFQESVRKLTELSGLRTIRLIDSKSGINPILWLVLLFGGVTTIVFTFLFGAESLNAQIAMATLLAVLIFLMLFTILLFDFPFTGGIRISPAAFNQVLSGRY